MPEDTTRPSRLVDMFKATKDTPEPARSQNKRQYQIDIAGVAKNRQSRQGRDKPNHIYQHTKLGGSEAFNRRQYGQASGPVIIKAIDRDGVKVWHLPKNQNQKQN